MPAVKSLVEEVRAKQAAQNATQPAGGQHTAPAVRESDEPGPRGGAALMKPLPSFLAAVPKGAQQSSELPEQNTGPYIAVASQRSNKWQALKAAGISEGEFYLATGAEYVRLNPFKYFVLDGQLFRTKMDSLGSIIAATRDLDADDLEEHAVVLVAAFVDGKLIPARADFRRTQGAAGITPLRAIGEAAQPGWSQLSPAHEVAAGFVVPCGRVVATVSGSARRISKSTGNPYYVPNVTVGPAGAEDMKLLSDSLGDDGFLADLQVAADGYNARVEQLSKLCR